MARWRSLVTLVLTLTITNAARAQTYSLTETPLIDSYHHVQLSMALSGTLKLQQEDKDLVLKESATATHDYIERLLEAGPDGTASKSARIYKDARASITVDADKLERTLRPERTFLMAFRERGSDGVLVYCPKGPLTHEELDVTDHFDTLAVTGLLPAKDVAMGETWKISNAAVQALCHLQGLSEHTLAGKLEGIKDNIATITVAGTATGIDLGATVNTTVKATCLFDTQKKAIVGVLWGQKEERGSGPASPASSIEVNVKVVRASVEPVNELSDVLLVPVRDVQPPRGWTDVFFKDTKNRFELVHARAWQLVGRSDQHTVLRLMDRGEFVAQVSIAPWKKAEPGIHLTPDEIKSIVANSPGWAQDTLIKSEDVKLPNGQWAYLVAGEGDLDGVRAVQYFYLVADPNGDQAVLTFTMTSAQTQKLGSRDLEFVQGFLLPGAARGAEAGGLSTPKN